MIFKYVLFNDFHSMLLQDLQYNHNYENQQKISFCAYDVGGGSLFASKTHSLKCLEDSKNWE